jgi:TolB-like protein
MVLERQSVRLPITIDRAHGPAVKQPLPEVTDKEHGASDSSKPARAPTVAWTRDVEIGEPEVREAVEKLAASRPFYRSQRLCHFLRLIVERMLQEPAAGLKEYPIATEVYGRPASFDPRSDPIVRVEARRLRAKLEEYYQTEGQNDAFQIGLPIGAYVPMIRKRERPTAGTEPKPNPRAKGIRIEPFVLDVQGSSSNQPETILEELVHALYAEGVMVCISHSGDKDEHPSTGNRIGGGRRYPLLQGTIRRQAADIRVLSRLTINGHVIWCGRYSRSICGAVDAEESIAHTMAADIRQVIGRDRRDCALRGSTTQRRIAPTPTTKT